MALLFVVDFEDPSIQVCKEQVGQAFMSSPHLVGGVSFPWGFMPLDSG